MYYFNKNKIKRFRSAKITVNDFSQGMQSGADQCVLPISYAAVSHNFDMSGGALKDGKGVKTATFGQEKKPLALQSAYPEKLYYYKKYDEVLKKNADILMCYASDGKIYRSSGNTFTEVDGLSFTSAPKAVCYSYNGDDVIIFSDAVKMAYYDGSSAHTVSDAPKITAMCIHNERLFATEYGEKTTLWFSDDFDPSNWNVSLEEAGFIDIKNGCGALLCPVSFDGYLYAFQSYGITRITAYGDQKEFATETAAQLSGSICKDSVTVCKNSIIFLASDGFYSFGGSVATRILTQFDENIFGVDNSDAKGRFFNGSLYVKMKMRLSDEIRDVLLVYDTRDKSAYICANLHIVDLETMPCESGARLLFAANGKKQVGELADKSEFYSKPVRKVWQSGETDLGVCDAKKSISTITMYLSGAVTIRIRSGKESADFCVKGDGLIVVPIRMSGYKFVISIISDYPSVCIAKFTVNYCYA